MSDVSTTVVRQPSGSAANAMWLILVGGLILALILILLALFHVIGDGVVATDTLVTIFSSILTGLLGLFAKSPTSP